MKQPLILIAFMLACHLCHAQSGAVMQANKSALTPTDVQHLLYFEGIGHERFQITSSQLKGKDFQILIKEFKDGVPAKTDTVFSSKEDEYFRIKEDSLPFAVFTKMTDLNEFKIQFQFNGYSVQRKYPVLPAEKEKFTLKSFFGPKTELPVNLNGINYFLAYLMPYVRKDKSEAYCEVAQSGIDPEQLYSRYKIPHYFLVAIIFE